MKAIPKSLPIGGEFDVRLQDYLRTADVSSIAQPSSSHCLWTDTGRSALLIAAQVILHRRGRPRVWLPAFGCESISQPFRQAGFDLNYYSVSKTLTGDDMYPPEPEAGDSLLFIHYFGHRNWPMIEAAKRYRQNGVWVIEDRVQASLTKQTELHGDFAVTSYRKALPVPDGATLLTAQPVIPSEFGLNLAAPNESFVSARIIAKLLRACGATPEVYWPLVESSESLLTNLIIPRHTSWLSQWMISRIDQNDVIAKRRANWLSLAKHLSSSGLERWIRPIFLALGADDIPLGLPVLVADGRRQELRRFLAEREVFCPVHWPLDHLPPDDHFSPERILASSILTLPIDQRMAESHIERLVSLISSFPW